MENEELENVNSQNDTEDTENVNEDVTEDVMSKESLEEEVRKATAKLYARVKQAEQEAKEAKAKLSKTKEEPADAGLSQKDVIYLAKADIHDDDLDEVTNYASKNGLSVREAHEYLKPILAVKAEKRKTANASNTGGSKRSSGLIPEDVLLDKARKTGEIPTNEADLERLIKARKGYKK